MYIIYVYMTKKSNTVSISSTQKSLFSTPPTLQPRCWPSEGSWFSVESDKPGGFSMRFSAEENVGCLGMTIMLVVLGTSFTIMLVVHKDPYETTSIVESKAEFFFVAHTVKTPLESSWWLTISEVPPGSLPVSPLIMYQPTQKGKDRVPTIHF